MHSSKYPDKCQMQKQKRNELLKCNLSSEVPLKILLHFSPKYGNSRTVPNHVNWCSNRMDIVSNLSDIHWKILFSYLRNTISYCLHPILRSKEISNFKINLLLIYKYGTYNPLSLQYFLVLEHDFHSTKSIWKTAAELWWEHLLSTWGVVILTDLIN